MLIKGDPDGAKSLPEQNVESIPVQFHRKCASYADKSFHLKFTFWNFCMNLPCDNELTGLLLYPAFRLGLSELTHIP